MGLRHRSPQRNRRIKMSTLVFVLAVQLIFGILQSSAAHAATFTTVSPDNLSGWQSSDLTHTGEGINFVNTNATSGSGSIRFDTSGSVQSRSLESTSLSGMKLADIATLGYDSFVADGDSSAPSLQLDIDKDVTDGAVNSSGHLVYSPYQNSNVNSNTWQYQNARDGKWWFEDASSFELECSKAMPCTLNTIITLYPNSGIGVGGIRLSVASNTNDMSVSYVDTLIINDTLYNFEAISAPRLSSPMNNSAINGTVLNASWQPVSESVGYIYESYTDELSTQLHVGGPVAESEKSELDITAGTTLWWRVKAVDAQGNEGPWSELWKVDILADIGQGSIIPPIGDIIPGGPASGTQELLTQMAKLNEPFAIPDPVKDTLIVPRIVGNGGVDIKKENSPILSMLSSGPATDEGAQALAATPTENGWRLLGVLWYWWLVPIIGAVLMLIHSLLRPVRREFFYSSEQI